jgi:diacylglycerol O-acyltransferase
MSDHNDAADANRQAWSNASEWGSNRRMTEFEALMWRSERHPQQSSTILSVMLLDTTPDWDRLVAAHQWAAQLIPRTRERVVDPVLPVGPPAWTLDEHFRLDYHLRRVRLPSTRRRSHWCRWTATARCGKPASLRGSTAAAPPTC